MDLKMSRRIEFALILPFGDGVSFEADFLKRQGKAPIE
jgi:hypothetical protein